MFNELTGNGHIEVIDGNNNNNSEVLLGAIIHRPIRSNVRTYMTSSTLAVRTYKGRTVLYVKLFLNTPSSPPGALLVLFVEGQSRLIIVISLFYWVKSMLVN